VRRAGGIIRVAPITIGFALACDGGRDSRPYGANYDHGWRPSRSAGSRDRPVRLSARLITSRRDSSAGADEGRSKKTSEWGGSA